VPGDQVDEVIMGNVVSAGLGQAPARQAAIHAGLPPKVAALTINKVCGSGLKAVMLAAQGIATGDTDVVVAGGMESMSNCPYLLPGAREGMRLGNGELRDSMIWDGLWDAYSDYHMGCTGEIVAEKYGVTREQQDQYALDSHRKAIAAIRDGRFKDAADESPREGTSLEALAKLKPAFKEGGTVTAGNAPGVNDGAAALVVTSADRAQALGCKPLARIVGQAVAGLDPSLVMMTPVHAVRKLWEKTGWSASSVDLFELNEAFAVQAVAVTRELELDPAKVNVNGGAVALGHPIGASGARILTTLLYALRDRGKRRGVATLCLGGGNGVALAVELL
jgi:acetyl-CoA C-acetyltransferase